ncbi:MAG TPA: S-layer homology domain-containing protein, partial [Firmicutes bacterium]|nr:S-layer homology domain-containing protein [Bacillota bacterium]
MKRTLLTFLVCAALLLASVAGSVAAGEEVLQKFSDVKNGDWYISSINTLYGLGVINGYPDGTFKPNGTITKGEFTRMIVSAKNLTVSGNKGGHWAEPYRDKAAELGWINKADYNNLDMNITRLEIASMVARACGETGENLDAFKDNLTDFATITNTTLRNEAITCYSLGIITGYPDQTFKPNKTATRAEASAMLVRMLYKNERQVPAPKGKKPKTTALTAADIVRLQSYPASKETSLYKSFEEVMAKSARYMPEVAINKFHPKDFTVFEGATVGWYTVPETVYITDMGYYG